MRLTILLFSIAVLAACGGGKIHRNSDTTILKATSQSWAGGAVGSGFGTNYEVQVGYTGTGEIKFDTLWVGARAFTPYVAKQKDDTYQLRARFTSRPITNPKTGEVDETKYIEMPPKSANPPEYEGEGLVIYHVDGKRYGDVIEQFEKLQQLNYP